MMFSDIFGQNDVLFRMETVARYSLDNAHVVVIGNKTDLKTERQISKEDGMKLAACYNAKYMEVSVKNDHNISKTLTKLTANICEKFKNKD